MSGPGIAVSFSQSKQRPSAPPGSAKLPVMSYSSAAVRMYMCRWFEELTSLSIDGWAVWVLNILLLLLKQTRVGSPEATA
jgi:hypothetical protein